MAKNYHSFLLAMAFAFSLAGCGELTLPEDIKENQSSTPSEGSTAVDTMVAVNDTARFYMSGMEIHNVMLSDSPTPSDLIKGERYRMPTRLEVFAVLKNVTIPNGIWESGQRILCYDTPTDNGIQIGSAHFGTGLYYTYIPNGTIVKAGMKTKYCIIPIRAERLSKTNERTIIEINDCWND